MGVTVTSLHVYSAEPIDPALGHFTSLSPGWQTMLPAEVPPINELYVFARKLSKKVSAPVLTFFMLDSDDLSFALFQAGKTVSYFSTFDDEAKKGIFQIPRLVGYPEGHKRHISEILSCGDVELLADLLEEFLGVALMVFEDIPSDDLVRIRGDERYRAFHEELRRIRGKRAPIRAVLADEFPGKLFSGEFSSNLGIRNGYLFGMETPESGTKDLRPVRFSQGKLLPLSSEDIVYVTRESLSQPCDPDIPANAVRFKPNAPEAFGGKTLTLPTGFDFFDFFDDRLLMLVNSRSGIAFMDAEGKLVARFSVKGTPVEFEDGYLLTAGSGSFWMYGYEPNNKIRVYRIEEK